MASFVDDEAEVGTTSEDEPMDAEESSAKKKKRAMISSDEDEDEDEDEDQIRKEMKGFVVEEDEEVDDSDGEVRRKKRKKKSRSRSKSRSDEDDDIDDDDRDLLKENLGVDFSKKRKRIRMESGSDSSDQGGSDAEHNEQDEIPDLDQGGAESGNESDGFIVDEHGQPLRGEKRKKKTHFFTDENLQMAEDIFGVDCDFGVFAEDDDEEDIEDYEDEDEEGREEAGAKRRKKRRAKNIFELFEPSELEARHFTDKDNEIRNKDIPERMQLRNPPVCPVEDDIEYEQEAEWIFERITKSLISKQNRDITHDDIVHWGRNKELVLEKLRQALKHIRQDFFEPVFINFYRKEYVAPELSIGALWMVYALDGEWCKLQTRKRAQRDMYEQCKKHQEETICADLEAEIPEDIRLVKDEDLMKIDTIQTVEELKDMDHLFKLYYSKDLHAIKVKVLKKKREDRETKKLLKKNKKREKKRKTKIVTDEETGKDIEVTDSEAEESEAEESEPEEEDEEEEEINEDEILKTATRNDIYSLCRKLNIATMVKEFGLEAWEFGENIQDGYQKIDVRQVDKAPLQVAEEYIQNSPRLAPDDAQQVLDHVKTLLANQIAADPKVRNQVREAFFERATMTVRPTKQGLREIDEGHDVYSLKYVSDKPCNSLEGDQWLKLIEAEKSKLLTIDFPEIPMAFNTKKTFFEDILQYFQYEAFSAIVKEWNNLRKECLEFAFYKLLYPMLKNELRNKLTREAKDGVITACRGELFEMLKVGKYDVDFEEEDEDDWGTKEGCRIMGIMYENDLTVASYAVVINPQGGVMDFLKLDHIMRRVNSFHPKEVEDVTNDLKLLKHFIKSKKPHAVVVGAADRVAINIKQKVMDVIKELEEEEQFPSIKVNLMNDNLSKVFANSKRAEQDFREFPNVLRQAISLARRMQDPLIEFTQLCGPENEILALRYHPLQDLLSEEELLEGLNLEFINRVCEVGVDLNECVAHPHMSNLVQFIAGLGPRKGTALLKFMRQSKDKGRLENRTQLVQQCRMGPIEVINSSGFIKINTEALGDSEVYVEALDGSRIHYEAYEWAKKMAVDALEYDEDDGNLGNALEEILQEPEKLAELDLEAFANELERQGYGKRLNTLYDIRNELKDMYKDFRDPYVEPSPEEIFNMVTKESPKTFYVGKLVMATVTGFHYKKPQGDELDKAAPLRKDGNTWQCPFCGQDDFPELTEVWNHFDAGTCPGKAQAVRVRLDNGVGGYIKLKDLSDSKDLVNPEDRVHVKQSIYCRITRINPERMQVDAICSSSALEDKDRVYKPILDDYFDHEAERQDKEAYDAERKKAQAKQSYVKRVIVHPNFKNIDYKRAEKILDNLEKDKSDSVDVEYQQGDVLIRPSSKGQDHLTVTWKVTDGIHQHIDVLEKNKINAFSLGQSLWIGNEEFEDLDEIIARHINPMASHARDLLNFKYYSDSQGGKREVAEEKLRLEKRAHPGKIHYFIAASKELPGKFMLSYMPRGKARHEYVTVLPDGFRFRQQTFDSLSNLFKWFKEHFRDPIPGTPMTPRGSNTQRTPYMTGTPGGGITPGAMSMANANTPYGGGTTPGGGYNVNTPYTPSGVTPILTPYNTPGPSHTPRAGGGNMPPPPIPQSQRGMHGHHPPQQQSRSYHQQSPSGYNRSPAPGGGRRDNNQESTWQSMVDGWSSRRSNRTTPRNDQGGGRTPTGYMGGSGSSHSTPQGSGSARGTPRDTPGGHHGSGGQRTPRNNRTPRGQFATDTTPLYDE